MYRLLADAVLVLHLLFILFVVCGALLTLRWTWMVWIHVPAMLWGAATEFFQLICPLTPLENSLRAAAGSSAYEGGFIQHYLQPLIYPPELSTDMQWLLGTLLITFNVILYSYLWLRLKLA